MRAAIYGTAQAETHEITFFMPTHVRIKIFSRHKRMMTVAFEISSIGTRGRFLYSHEAFLSLSARSAADRGRDIAARGFWWNSAVRPLRHADPTETRAS